MTPNSPPPPSPPPSSKLPLVGVLAGVLLVGGVGVFLAKRDTKPTGPTQSTPDASVEVAQTNEPSAFDSNDSQRPPPVFTPLDSSVVETEPLFWLDVRDPAATHLALKRNVWLGKALKDPVGQGFLAAWGGFYGTRGQDIGGAFEGTVVDMVMDQVLSKPYRIVWFGGSGTTGVPALIVPAPSATATTAFNTLIKVAGSGGFQAPACAGADAGVEVPQDGGATESSIHRVVLADKTLFVVKLSDRIVLATGAQAANAAMCTSLVELKPREGVAVTLGASLKQGGRATQTLGELIGVTESIGLDFGLDHEKFVPKGIDAELAHNVLSAGEPTEALLKAIPESAGVVMFLTLKLPKELTATSLRDTLGPDGEDFKKTRKQWPAGPDRQVAIVWNPRGTGMEVAVLWANTADEAALAKAMEKGSGALKASKVCPVLAFSTSDYLATLEATCSGKAPSMLKAAAPIVTGFKQAASFSLIVNVGKVLSQLTLDGFASEHPAETHVGAGPEEIEAARRLLEELPAVGFTGKAQGTTLISGGFRS